MNSPQNSYHLALAIPDNRTVKSYVDAQGAPQFIIPNQLKLPEEFLSTFTGKEQVVWFPQAGSESGADAGLFVNCCTNFEDFRKGLESMNKSLPLGLSVFNHPLAVAHAASDNFRMSLDAVNGITVPKTISIRPSHPDHFLNAVEKSGMRLPLRVQFAGNQTNRPDAVVRNEADWDKVFALQWPKRWFRITQLDSRDLAQHARLRMTVVGTDVEQIAFPFAYGENALIHGVSLRVPMSAEQLRKLFVQVARRVPLDYWTAEFSFRSANEICLEYLWPGLPLVEPPSKSDLSAALWPKVVPHLGRLLASPDKWKSAARVSENRLH